MKLIAGFVILLAATAPTFAVDYTNTQLGFSVKLPNGLEDLTTVIQTPSLISLGTLNEDRTGVVKLVSIQDLGGAIGREDITAGKSIPANVAMEKIVWKSFQVDVFKVAESANGVSLITFNAQIPLKPRAIQVMVSGLAENELSLRAELQTIVASVDGPTNWLTTEERVAKGVSGLGRLIALGCVVIAVLVLGVRKLVRRRTTH